jgi:hypothetical protein
LHGASNERKLVVVVVERYGGADVGDAVATAIWIEDRAPGRAFLGKGPREST